MQKEAMLYLCFLVCLVFSSAVSFRVINPLYGPEVIGGEELNFGTIKIGIKKDEYVEFRDRKFSIQLNKNDWRRLQIIAPTLENYMGLYHLNDEFFVNVGQVKNLTLTDGYNGVTIPPHVWRKIREKMSYITKTLLIKFDP